MPTSKMPGIYLKRRTEIIENIIESSRPSREVNLVNAYNRGNKTLSGYVTLDWQHRADIRSLKERIKIICSRSKPAKTQ